MNQSKTGRAGKTVNPGRVAEKAEHAQHAHGVIQQGEPGWICAAHALGEDRNLRCVAEEEFRVAPEFEAEGQEDQQRRAADDRGAGQRVVPADPAPRRRAARACRARSPAR
jgi:hypothetical protein